MWDLSPSSHLGYKMRLVLAQLGLLQTCTYTSLDGINLPGSACQEPSQGGGMSCEDWPQGQEELGGPVLGPLHSLPNKQMSGKTWAQSLLLC